MVRITTALRFGLIITFLSALPASAGAGEIPMLYGSDGAALARSRLQYLAGDPAVTAIVHALQANADKALRDDPYSVTHKKHVLPGTDLHDYISIAPYYWPNPATPDHLPYVERDGQRNPEFMEYDAQPLMDLTDHAYVLALTGYFTGDARYSHRAAELIRTWFLDPATRMNPNFDHAQMVEGVNEGNHGGIIESRRIIMLIDAMHLAHQNGAWSDSDEEAFRQWLRPFCHWLLTSKAGRDEGEGLNNHGTWCNVQAATYCIYLGDDQTARQVLEKATEKLNFQMFPDGQMPFEQARTRSFWYVQFYMEGITQLADMGKRVGVDLWNYHGADGTSIRHGLDYLVPFATGQKHWIHQEIGGFTGKTLMVSLRRAGAAWNTNQYEPAIAQLKGWDVPTDEDREHPLFPRGLTTLLFPAPAP